MKITYRHRMFAGILGIFLLFSSGVILIEGKQEESLRRAALESRLDGYAGVVHAAILRHPQGFDDAEKAGEELRHILPSEVRISIIDSAGRVLADNEVNDISLLDNHRHRPEIKDATEKSHGSTLRRSGSTGHKYLYYARRFEDGNFIRVALPYNTNMQEQLRAGNLFIYFTGVLFIVVLLMINYIAGRFSQSIRRLKEFASAIKQGRPLPSQLPFPKDELGDIGNELIDIFKQSEQGRQAIIAERGKLNRHIRFSGEGLCIFSPDMKAIYSNTSFIQYINLISDQPMLGAEDALNTPAFRPIADFISSSSRENNHADFRIRKNAKTFSVQAVVFHDESFEIIIKDITKVEQTRLLKQEMTSNIAHELRTPVTSLRGYLETLTSQALDADKQKQFLDRAFLQSIRLSNLIEDTGLISKIEDAPSQFPLELLYPSQIISEVRDDLSDKLHANNILFVSSVESTLTLNGSYTLLYSVFRNLIDNSISYGGHDIEININNYSLDENYLYFSYYDTGFGVDERHLSRLFERFYRISEGRTRDTGGSGLGLSIVKNAILFHKGDIQVKNRLGGGLEFLFTLKRNLRR
ncbi:MAG: two-component sensor histidine kinase [Tannerellaceae bacterium]|jgi:two-component system OmpR family sensor kinase/two-component system phosphate regulon sensor histidine kinase PhoR|nr:two-component sensor histidine kinase [Tannerellaceae bacterium]